MPDPGQFLLCGTSSIGDLVWVAWRRWLRSVSLLTPIRSPCGPLLTPLMARFAALIAALRARVAPLLTPLRARRAPLLTAFRAGVRSGPSSGPRILRGCGAGLLGLGI